MRIFDITKRSCVGRISICFSLHSIKHDSNYASSFFHFLASLCSLAMHPCSTML